MKMKLRPAGLLCAALAFAMIAGCAIIATQKTSTLKTDTVSYDGVGGVKIAAVEGGNATFNIVCPFCGHVGEPRTVPAPAPGSSWQEHYDCPNCAYSGKVVIHAATIIAPPSAPANTPPPAQ